MEPSLNSLAAQSFAAFSLALLGGLHCAGMCGGIVGALQLNRPPGVSAARLAAGYHAGRVVSYSLAGMLAGTLGAALYAADVLPVQAALLLIGSSMLLAIGVSMFGRAAWMRRIEPAGVWLWRLIGPLARRVYPPRTAAQALAAGLAWGWIPCGMVYAALPLALVAGGPLQGGLVMLAFGLGTLPNMLAVDVAVHGIGRASRSAPARAIAWVRPLAGAMIVVFGISGLAHAARVAGVAGSEHPAIAMFARICHQ
ncbi:MAG: sulfite exporter TauE/SafE family protein [Burkholderiales bacterium]|nr:MAG: sulfite exporter TauE/SafE family protein [Burkholderiales bacterium]